MRSEFTIEQPAGAFSSGIFLTRVGRLTFFSKILELLRPHGKRRLSELYRAPSDVRDLGLVVSVSQNSSA